MHQGAESSFWCFLNGRLPRVCWLLKGTLCISCNYPEFCVCMSHAFSSDVSGRTQFGFVKDLLVPLQPGACTISTSRCLSRLHGVLFQPEAFSECNRNSIVEGRDQRRRTLILARKTKVKISKCAISGKAASFGFTSIAKFTRSNLPCDCMKTTRQLLTEGWLGETNSAERNRLF